MITHQTPQAHRGKLSILSHVVHQLLLRAVVWLIVVVHVTKPVERVLVLNQSLITQLFRFQAFIVIVTTEPKVEFESRNQRLELLLCCNESL